MSETTEPGSPRVGGIVLGSTDPRRLWEWYRDVFAPGLTRDGAEDGGPVRHLRLGGTYVLFEARDDVGRKSVEPGRVLVNVEVTGIRDMERRLNAQLNPRWIRPIETVDEHMLLGTLEDPDGNYVQLCDTTDDGTPA
ncbi:VOC family protein [Streptomyces tubbatahanensis]|uniref:VOC family protein n=1 Tax=Streptomyces tubbatahanensis TaxID=2923272 RepID=A0ABY3XSJ8_9ACTN|nr:VOC family protein [Streptomyces tubbatahanensis]UNS97399.1 VOC family protein [Streptomyces tubbatahanensis]